MKLMPRLRSMPVVDCILGPNSSVLPIFMPLACDDFQFPPLKEQVTALPGDLGPTTCFGQLSWVKMRVCLSAVLYFAFTMEGT